ncbi:unnamed protein product [Psylliodes chrysocephalus]|uniref:Uncharacterized protein n=1 Tax=Psylliodes chrysocephalus TaxID=3402493 RepID=A0A9P0D5W9_9CUCU|nr:unnamed protein product [Psylliodes chrysocephala]
MNHTNFNRVDPKRYKRGRSKNCDCPAEMHIKIKLTTKDTMKKDTYVKVGEYEDLIVSSSISNNFDVKHVTHVDVASFKQCWPDFFKKKVLSTRCFGKQVPKEDKVNFTINSFYEFSFNSENLGVIFAKQYIGSFVGERFLLLKTLQRNIPTIMVPDPQNFPVYQGKIPINVKKIEDIKKLQQYIPDKYKEFYTTICKLAYYLR